MQEEVMKTALAATLIVCAAAPALAQNVTALVQPTWTHVEPADAFINPTLPGSFSWGQTAPGSIFNILTLTSNFFETPLETPFRLGTLRYQNGGTLGTLATDVDLHLTLNFDFGGLGGPLTPVFVGDYHFEIVTTDHVPGDPDASADYVNLPSGFSTTSFLIDGTQYHVQLLDFRNIVGDGFLPSTGSRLHVREQGRASADLFAIITAEGPPVEPPPVAAVPEPQTYALMLAGLGAVGWVSRRRRR
jgi:hypothetical protein